MKRTLLLLVGTTLLISACATTPPVPGPTVPTALATHSTVPTSRTPSSEQSTNARGTSIALSRTREAEVRIRQTQTGPVHPPTLTPLPTFPPTQTFTPWWTFSPAPSPTATPQPTLQANTFSPADVLIELRHNLGGGSSYWPGPSLILYGDGLLVRALPSGGYEHVPYGRMLARFEVCQLLNTIDQFGFFDFRPENEIEPCCYGMGGYAGRLQVRAWQANEVDLNTSVLDAWLEAGREGFAGECQLGWETCNEPPDVTPALANTYNLLSTYDPGGLQPLPVEALLIFTMPDFALGGEVLPWPVTSLKMADLFGPEPLDLPYKMFEVNDPAVIQILYQHLPNGCYSEGNLAYCLLIRPRWPYLDGADRARTPAPSGPEKQTTIDCSPQMESYIRRPAHSERFIRRTSDPRRPRHARHF